MVSLWHAFDSAGAPVPRQRAEATASIWPSAKRSTCRTQLLSAEEARGHAPAWRDLAERALQPNPFLEPEVALAAAIHLAQGHPPRFLFVWEDEPASSRLLGLAALTLSAFGLGPARLWLAPHMLPGPPLLDRERAQDALEALFTALRAGPARATGLLVPHIDVESAFATSLRRAAVRCGLRIAPLDGGPAEARTPSLLLDGKRSTARAPRRVRDAVEHFLAIEASGGRGRDGTAMLLSPSQSAFLRVVTRALARKRRCRVVLSLQGGKPVAADIILASAGREIVWKTARLDHPGSSEGEIGGTGVDWLVTAAASHSPAALAAAARHGLARQLHGLARWAQRRTSPAG